MFDQTKQSVGGRPATGVVGTFAEYALAAVADLAGALALAAVLIFVAGIFVLTTFGILLVLAFPHGFPC